MRFQLIGSLNFEYSKNKFACEIMDRQLQDDRYTIIDDVIYYKDRIYLLSGLKLKEKIVRAIHDTPLERHPGYFKTYR